ncbi:hypothetical protein HYPSUDRAFT_190438 [Hypholoma sublateritium FD-334 SS-4]|uniref:Uncharacterized protein n=1 Tax=Hypholoma sublateritium (strain FD-334 SS-4) TaxID=945553 RepID=A0A0D2NQ77_HYPSF|nr:hypothetical protein HYPSUDRAFT_190438 [Hypholoma sublateritium FD-334 SS-4]
MEVNLFFSLAEAAEKYLVHGVMLTCITRMELTLHKTHPIQVLNHSGKHGYEYLANLAAPMTIPSPIREVVDGLKFPGLLSKWV